MKDELQTYIEPELEARIVALVLGEASAFETEELERLMLEKPELKAYRIGLEKIHGVVTEAHREQDHSEWKLSEDRRGKILAKIEERKRHEMVEARRRRISGIAQRRLIYSCAACLVLTLVILVLSQPLASIKKDESRSMAVSESRRLDSSSGEFDLWAESAYSIPKEELLAEWKSANNENARWHYSEEQESLDVVSGRERRHKIKVEGAMAILDDALAVNDIEPETASNQSGSLEVVTGAVDRFFDGGEGGRKSRMAVASKPSAPTPSKSESIAANSTSPSAIPVPDVEIPDPVADFGDGVENDESFSTGGIVSGGSRAVSAPQNRPGSVALGDAIEDMELSGEQVPWDFELTGDNDRNSSSQDDPFGFEDEFESMTRETRVKRKLDSEGRVATLEAKDEGRSAGGSARGSQNSKKSGVALRKKAPVTALPTTSPASFAAVEDKNSPAEAKVKLAEQSVEVSEQLQINELNFDGIVAPNEGGDPGRDSTLLAGLSKTIAEKDGDEIALGIQPRRSGKIVMPDDSDLEGIEVEESDIANDLFRQEMIDRAATVEASDKLLTDARSNYSDGDYESAVEKYREALNTLPHGTATKDRRDFLQKSLEDGSVALTQKFRREGKYQEARDLLKEVDKNSPGSAAVRKELEYLDDPIRTESSLSYEHTKNVDKVRRNLYEGESLYNLGLYDKAEEEFKETLRIDPYNKAARRWMERTSAIKSDYYRAAYDHTRAEMLMKVDRAWELSVPSESEREFSEQEAREELKKANRELVEAKQELARLDDLPGSELSTEDADQVRRGLYKGEGYYNLGLYDKAKEEFENTLKVDPANKAAYRWMGKTASTKSEYYQAALDPNSDGKVDPDGDGFLAEDDFDLAGNTSANRMGDSKDFLFGVNGGGSLESSELFSLLPGDPASADTGRSIISKVDQIIVPEVRFENATVGEALEVLRQRSVELDNTTLDESQKGLNLVVDDARILDRKLPKIEMKNAPLREVFEKISEATGTTAIQDDFAVRFGREDAWGVFAKARYDGNEVTNAKLNQLILPEVQLNRASINEAVEFLKSRSIELDSTTVENGKKGFDVQIEEGVDQEALVGQLTLKNVPLKVAVEGIARQAGCRVRVEEGKIVFFADPNLPQKDSTKGFETSTKEKTDSTFSLNVSDVSFKLAKAALGQGNWPDASKVRPEEFVNALSYDDVKPTQSEKISCEIEQGSHPFMQQRNLMRVSMSTASLGRNAATPLRLTILLDQSGSMERADRAESVQKAFALLAAQLNPNDEVTLVGFARTPRLLAERVKGNEVGKLAGFVANPLTEGGTNLEEALSTGLQLAKQQFLKGAQNRIILLTDGAANLGDAKPANLASQVESMRRADIAFDACGVGADGLNDDVLSSLTKQGDGRYYFLDRPEDADDGFARQIAGALRPAAKNVKVQVLFNPERVSTFKLYGFEKHKLKKEDFRNDSVDAAEMAAEESGVAVYHFEPMPEGRGDIGTVSVRFFDTTSNQMIERTWSIPYQEEADFFSKADPKLRLASVAALFAEKLKASPVGDRVELKKLRQEIQLLRPDFGNQTRFNELQTMLQQAGD